MTNSIINEWLSYKNTCHSHKGYLETEYIKKYGESYDLVEFHIVDKNDLLELEKMEESKKANNEGTNKWKL